MVLREQEITLRKYLLGDLPEKEQESLELWLMSEEEAYDLLSAAEDDLIDQSIAGNLDRHELERFNNHFLTAPARKRKLWFSQGFQNFVAEHLNNTTQEVPTPFTFWGLFRRQPVFAYAAAALLVLVMGGGLWGGLQYQDLQRRLSATEAQFAVDREAFIRQLNERKAFADRMQSELGELEQIVANVKSAPAPDAVVAVILTAGLTRASTELPIVKLSSKAQVVELSLPLLDGGYDSYRAVLFDESGIEIWTRDGLPAKTTGEDKTVAFVVPIDRLTAGDYVVRLSGHSGLNPPEDITTYPFRATR